MDSSLKDYKIEIEKLENTFNYARFLQKKLNIVVNKIKRNKGIKDSVQIIMNLNDLSYDLYETYQEAVESALKIMCKEDEFDE